MTNYYFAASILPDIQLGVPAEIDFHGLDVLIRANLTAEDSKKVAALRLFYDIQNIRSFWRDEPLSYRGNYDHNELDEALLTRSGLPDYIFDFMDRYESKKDRLYNFAWLLSAYFAEEIPKADGFLKGYLQFERDLRLVLIGLRAKALGRDILQELQFEDPDDDLVAQLIAQKDSPDYEPPERFSEVKSLFEENYEHPLDFYQILAEYRFQKVDEILGIDFFSVDRILAYMAKLIIVEKWLELDKKKGMEIVDTILKEVS